MPPREPRRQPQLPIGAGRSGVPPAAKIDLIVLRSLAVSGVRFLVSLVLATAWIFPAAAEAATHLKHPTALETFPHFEAHDGVHHADHCLLDVAAMVADPSAAEIPLGKWSRRPNAGSPCRGLPPVSPICWPANPSPEPHRPNPTSADTAFFEVGPRELEGIGCAHCLPQ